jgi:hypothetical protein
MTSASVQQPTADTAIFPSPTTSFAPRFPNNASPTDCNCQGHTPSGPDATITRENVAQQAGKMIHQMLQFPMDENTLVDNDTLQLPDIRAYLPANTDLKLLQPLQPYIAPIVFRSSTASDIARKEIL